MASSKWKEGPAWNEEADAVTGVLELSTDGCPPGCLVTLNCNVAVPPVTIYAFAHRRARHPSKFRPRKCRIVPTDDFQNCVAAAMTKACTNWKEAKKKYNKSIGAAEALFTACAKAAGWSGYGLAACSIGLGILLQRAQDALNAAARSICEELHQDIHICIMRHQPAWRIVCE